MDEWEAQRIRDEEHLNLLGIFNFVLAGLSLFGSLMFLPHLLVLESGFFDRVFEEGTEHFERQAEEYERQHGEEFPIEMDRATAEFIEKGIRIFVVGGILVALGSGLLCLFSGLGLRGRRWRGLSMAVAVLQLFAMPVGTVLGIFTIVVIGRRSVQELYLEAADPRARYGEEF
ncbi:MAG: hypothetical protein ABFS86_01775 [Planctomycetota bacterium]